MTYMFWPSWIIIKELQVITKRRYNTAYTNQSNCNYFKFLDNGGRGRQTADSLGFALNKVNFIDFNCCDCLRLI
jgi:hypothetical protein